MYEESPTQAARTRSLRPLAYHDAVVAYLKQHESEVWKWACSARSRTEHADAVRNDLLRHAYRLDEVSHPEVHRAASEAAERLDLRLPISLYQGGDGPINASLYFLTGEAHIVFSGPLLDRLSAAEVQAILGHELAHYRLWSQDDGIYHAADRILEATADHPGANAAHRQTARLYRLFTEAYADQGSVIACGALDPAVAALVKSMTGLGNVSPSSYLAQAAEVIAKNTSPSAATTHPESFLRVHALQRWVQGDPNAGPWLDKALRGGLGLEGLDLVAQLQLQSLTRRVIGEILRPGWMRSEASLAHARQFFPDFATQERGADDALTKELQAAPETSDYLSGLLLDFATSDRETGDAALSHAIELADRWGIGERLQARMQKDLKIPKRQHTKLKQGARALIEKTERNHGA